jgi:hypothetical protein
MSVDEKIEARSMQQGRATTRKRDTVQLFCEAAVIFSGYLAYDLADDLTRPFHPAECSL